MVPATPGHIAPGDAAGIAVEDENKWLTIVQSAIKKAGKNVA